MSKIFKPLALLALLALPSGCKTWAELGEMTVEIEAPEKVSRFGSLVFRVKTADLQGLPLGNVHYEYSVDWPGVRGMKHRGVSFRSESILVKGPPGQGVLRIYTLDANGNFVEGVKKEFMVQ